MTAGRLPIGAGRVAAALLALVVTFGCVACSSAPGPDGSLARSVLAGLPVPPSAVLTVGAGGPGVDGDSRFYAYTSTGTPKAELAAYDAALRAADYQPVQRAGAWTAYRRADVTVWVSVSVDGPPTSIVTLVAGDPTSAALPARLDADPSAEALLANVPSDLPPTPEPQSRDAGPSPSPRPGGKPSAAPGSPTPAASADPTASPQPSAKPKPSHTTKPSPKPKPTPRPKPTHVTGNGG